MLLIHFTSISFGNPFVSLIGLGFQLSKEVQMRIIIYSLLRWQALDLLKLGRNRVGRYNGSLSRNAKLSRRFRQVRCLTRRRAPDRECRYICIIVRTNSELRLRRICRAHDATVAVSVKFSGERERERIVSNELFMRMHVLLKAIVIPSQCCCFAVRRSINNDASWTNSSM